MPKSTNTPTSAPTVESTELPITLKPYIVLGLDLQYKQNESNAVADCPFCGADGKFSVNLETGLAHCWVCVVNKESPKGGTNPLGFLRLLHKLSWGRTTPEQWQQLADERKILSGESLAYWGACVSVLSGKWLVPGYSPDGRLWMLYRWSKLKDKQGNWYNALLPIPNVHQEGKAHGLHGLEVFSGQRESVLTAEGFWDGVALWEACKLSGLLEELDVVAVPGANVWQGDSWNSLYSGKSTALLYDNDHPRENGQRSGFDGMRRVTLSVLRQPKPPKEITAIQWGPNGHDPALADGFDVRDYLAKDEVGTRALRELRRPQRLQQLFQLVKPIPSEWVTAAKEGRSADGTLPLKTCHTWQKLLDTWFKPNAETGKSAMYRTEGLERALACMLASCMSVRLLTGGAAVWLKVISPPSTGKTTLAEALATATRYVFSVSKMTGIHSGWKEGKNNDDHSLLPLIMNKTLIIKDADTLLRAANREKILSELRDLYDNVTRAQYLNGISREYLDVRCTVILCGTSSLRVLDSSELGERFLDVVVMDQIDPNLELSIGLSAIESTIRNMTELGQADGAPDTTVDPELALARAMTGGYVTYLRENCEALMSRIVFPEQNKLRCANLGTFVAFMRSRPSKGQEEETHRELSTRLIKQLTGLSLCLTAVLNKTEVDEDVMSYVTKVAMDTARGRTLEIIRHLHAVEHGLTMEDLVRKTGQDERTELKLLQHLRHVNINAVEDVLTKKSGYMGVSSTLEQKWRITDRLRKLWDTVILRTEPTDEQSDTEQSTEPERESTDA